jgi:hypothetical protein
MMAGYGLWLERFAANGVVVDVADGALPVVSIFGSVAYETWWY